MSDLYCVSILSSVCLWISLWRAVCAEYTEKYKLFYCTQRSDGEEGREWEQCKCVDTAQPAPHVLLLSNSHSVDPSLILTFTFQTFLSLVYTYVSLFSTLWLPSTACLP